RYVKIYFGMLTLAFGMLFYSFLYKFYTLTGGDEGMRVLRPVLLGRPLEHLDTVAFLTGPFYYYALAVLVLAALVMRRLEASPFGLSLRSIRENAIKAESLGLSVRRYRLAAFVVAAVFGPNGAGKTTLMNVLTGLTVPTSGRVTFKGVDVVGATPVRLARLGMARSFQLVTIFPGLSVGETLAVAALARLGRSARPFTALARDLEVRAAVDDVAALFGLADKLGRAARTLPQGDKKLLDVAS